MNTGAVLDIHLIADINKINITPYHCVEPKTAVVAGSYITNDGGIRSNEIVVAELWVFVFYGKYNWHRFIFFMLPAILTQINCCCAFLPVGRSHTSAENRYRVNFTAENRRPQGLRRGSKITLRKLSVLCFSAVNPSLHKYQISLRLCATFAFFA
jgi:hypothetical protein